MSKRESIARYSLIIKKLRKHPASFSDIEEYLALESEIQAYNFNISKRTFLRDREDIRSLYNIEILYDFSKKVYFIDFDDQPEVSERILEAFEIFNALNVADRLSNYIHFEKRKPHGTEHLNGILHAIKNHFQIKFVYRKYWDDELTERTVEPLALKEFKNRWYVLSKDFDDNTIKSFALDRLADLEISKRKFNFPKDFDVIEHYKYCFGIISPNGHLPEDVILSFNAFQGKYIKSLPLHDSQEILLDNQDELRIRLRLFITHDFFMELLSFGQNLKVLSPQTLIDDLISTSKNIQRMYD
ncbi:helix-turn-helix transcriptional regulator [Sphingobacterium sp. 1.A.4]|uniref:helix-turn-helix transcriptional regulator n=1 Tax=Sphingobacterium sp. 1.A.4 TaxID=2044603 RepID=UPI000C0BECC7|nr:WYL domain-containing protein [Sphingobacterium sp. 1.A.4]